MERTDGIIDMNERVESKVRCYVGLARLRQAEGDATQRRLNLGFALGIAGGKLEQDLSMMIDSMAQLRCAEDDAGLMYRIAWLIVKLERSGKKYSVLFV
jgi:hypothetical protein